MDGLRLTTAILAFEAERGRLPDGLGELVPAHLDAVPVDPFDPAGVPIRYVRTGYPMPEGERLAFRLWSVGWDGEDDGGVFDDRKGSNHWRETELDIPLGEVAMRRMWRLEAIVLVSLALGLGAAWYGWVHRYRVPSRVDVVAEYNALLDATGPWDEDTQRLYSELIRVRTRIDDIEERVTDEHDRAFPDEHGAWASMDYYDPVRWSGRPWATEPEQDFLATLGALADRAAEAQDDPSADPSRVEDEHIDSRNHVLGSESVRRYMADGVSDDLAALLRVAGARVTPPSQTGDRIVLLERSLESLSMLRQASLAERSRARAALAKGDHERAIEAYTNIIYLARIGAEIPMAIGPLVAHSILSLATGDLGEACAGLPAEHRPELAEAVARALDDWPDPLRAVEGDRLSMFVYLEGFYRGWDRFDSATPSGILDSLLASRGEEWMRLEEIYAEWQIWLGRPWAACVADPKRTPPTDLAQRAPSRCVFLDEAVSDIDKLIRMAHARALMRIELRLVTALHAFGAQRGRWPESLDELVPEHLDAVPIDPFDPKGATIRYALDATTDEQGGAPPFRLWSVGWDGEDDGGVFDSVKESEGWKETELDVPLSEGW